MGKLHPHGDSAIYDALVRMAQPFSMRLPLVDGHGNFGSLADDPPAAMRYTEARLAAAAMLMAQSIDEDTVDFRPNYDGQETEPHVPAGGVPEPAGQRHHRHRGRDGHQHAAAQPRRGHRGGPAPDQEPGRDARRPDALRAGPRPADRRRIVGLDGIRDAYETGRGTFRMRAKPHASSTVTPRRKGIVVTELPFNVGPERVISEDQGAGDRQEAPGHRRPQGPHRPHKGLRIWSSRSRTASTREAVLGGALPADADGGDLRHQQRGAGRRAAAHPRPAASCSRSTWTTASTSSAAAREYRRRKREERLHLVDGLLIALLNIDEVIQVIRTSEDSAGARARLMDRRAERDPGQLHPRHAAAPPDPLRQAGAGQREGDAAARRSPSSPRSSSSDDQLRKVVSDELAEVAKTYGDAPPHRPAGGGGCPRSARRAARGRGRPVPGPALLDRPAGPHADASAPAAGARAKHDVLISLVDVTTGARWAW